MLCIYISRIDKTVQINKSADNPKYARTNAVCPLISSNFFFSEQWFAVFPAYRGALPFGPARVKNVSEYSTLGFATRSLTANLGLATSRAATDLLQYINSKLGFSDLKICF